MKANEAPEKLWWSEGAVWHTNPDSISYVEYTCTDAFIEKAAEWLEDNASNYIIEYPFSSDVCFEEDKMIEDFKNYMKRE